MYFINRDNHSLLSFPYQNISLESFLFFAHFGINNLVPTAFCLCNLNEGCKIRRRLSNEKGKMPWEQGYGINVLLCGHKRLRHQLLRIEGGKKCILRHKLLRVVAYVFCDINYCDLSFCMQFFLYVLGCFL